MMRCSFNVSRRRDGSRGSSKVSLEVASERAIRLVSRQAGGREVRSRQEVASRLVKGSERHLHFSALSIPQQGDSHTPGGGCHYDQPLKVTGSIYSLPVDGDGQVARLQARLVCGPSRRHALDHEPARVTESG